MYYDELCVCFWIEAELRVDLSGVTDPCERNFHALDGCCSVVRLVPLDLFAVEWRIITKIKDHLKMLTKYSLRITQYTSLHDTRKIPKRHTIAHTAILTWFSSQFIVDDNKNVRLLIICNFVHRWTVCALKCIDFVLCAVLFWNKEQIIYCEKNGCVLPLSSMARVSIYFSTSILPYISIFI